MTACPLCHRQNPSLFYKNTREFWRCSGCRLIFVPDSFHLKPKDEKARYLEHRNDPNDEKYRAFLDQVVAPLKKYLQGGERGLDFGSGPGPTLSVMFRQQGFFMADFDPYFAPDQGQLAQTYDFITCTETLEHLGHPHRELETLNGLLCSGGILGLMTSWYDDEMDFPSWYYHRDPTHIAFYSVEALKWIGGHWGWRFEFPQKNVTLFFKP